MTVRTIIRSLAPALLVGGLMLTPGSLLASPSGGHGPAIQLFGHELSTGAQFGIRLINFGIFFAILFFALKGVLATAFKTRAKELEDRLSQAERDKAEGQKQIQELESKMAGLQAELDSILAKAEADAESEKQRILEGARADAATLVAQARAEIESRQRQAEMELKALVADLAIEASRVKLEARLQGDEAVRFIDRAIQQVGGAR